jgi:glucosamine--fructose-6-phosphate aminotransferase (isomerizing)
MVATSCERGSVIASDLTALIEFSKEYFVVPEYHILTLKKDGIDIQDLKGNKVTPQMLTVNWDITSAQKGGYPFFMLKEIYEQPDAIQHTLSVGLDHNQLKDDFLSSGTEVLPSIQHVQIIACGTSYHAGMVAKYWCEQLIGLSCQVEIASEFRYRSPVVLNNTLFIYISQSGETADTLAALRDIQKRAQASHKTFWSYNQRPSQMPSAVLYLAGICRLPCICR